MRHSWESDKWEGWETCRWCWSMRWKGKWHYSARGAVFHSRTAPPCQRGELPADAADVPDSPASVAPSDPA